MMKEPKVFLKDDQYLKLKFKKKRNQIYYGRMQIHYLTQKINPKIKRRILNTNSLM